MEILVRIAGSRLPFITLPKPCSAGDVQVQIEALREIEQRFGVDRRIRVHVLIETHGALRKVWKIAALSGVESLDFVLMDFVSGHHGAIPGSAMKSPGQYEHPLVARAKCEIRERSPGPRRRGADCDRRAGATPGRAYLLASDGEDPRGLVIVSRDTGNVKRDT